jgi:ATP-dependent DNA ligase
MEYRFPRLVYANQRGTQNYWQIYVQLFDENGVQQPISDDYLNPKLFPAGWYAVTHVDSGQVGGKNVSKTPHITREGKNQGKKNETSPWGQALADAQSKHDKQAKFKLAIAGQHSDDDEESPASGRVTFVPPQKLETYKPGVIKDFTNIYCELKYNGTHCLATLVDGVVHLKSTQNKDYYGSKLKAALAPLMSPNIFLDGELWARGLKLQEITSIAKNPEKDGEGLTYILYDAYFVDTPEATQYERKAYLNKTFRGLEPLISIAPSIKIQSEADVELAMEKSKEQGMEGIVIRDYLLPYKPAFNKGRSKNYKLKHVDDAEFEVIGFVEGKHGKGIGQILFVCITPDGHEFTVTPAESEEWRRAEFRKCATDPGYFAATYEHQMYTVEYRDTTEDGIPSHAVGKVFGDAKE